MQTSTLASLVALFSLMGPILALPQDNDQYLTPLPTPTPEPTDEPVETTTVAPVAETTTAEEEEYPSSTSDCPTTTITVQMWGDEPKVMTIGGAEFDWVYIRQKYNTESDDDSEDMEEVTSMPHAPYMTYDGTAVVTDTKDMETEMQTGTGTGAHTGGGYGISGPETTGKAGSGGDKYNGAGRVLATESVLVLVGTSVLMGAALAFAL